MRSSRLLFLAGILGSTGVGLGAFGAHALKERLALAGMTAVWDKAVLYHLIHSAALLAAAVLSESSQAAAGRWFARTGVCWFWGVVFFSGSLYFLALGGPKFLGPITPLGGILLLAGWIGVMVASRAKDRQAPT